MAIAASTEALERELIEMANAQFESPEFKRLLSVRFTWEGARIFEVQRHHFVRNRRDCWGYVQGSAPLEVKQMVWEHEREELIGDADKGQPDHITLSMKEGELFGLTPEDFERIPPTDVAQTCFDAWLYLAKNRPWLEALAASSILEVVVSDEIIRGGGIARRVGEKLAHDLGVPLRRQANNAAHIVADMEHAQLLFRVVRQYAHTEEAQRAVLRGAKDSLRIERVWRGHLADLIASYQR